MPRTEEPTVNETLAHVKRLSILDDISVDPTPPPKHVEKPRAPEPTTTTASEALKAFARDHVKPTIEALTQLRNVVEACRTNLEAHLQKLEENSESFAAHNEEAQHCLRICADAVKQLVGKSNGS